MSIARRTVAIAIVWVACAGGAYGQTSADGVDAFIRGDYRRAAQVLKPIAEAWPPSGDQSATFFMAALYDNGLGVPVDHVRACALYRATVIRPHRVLVRLALELSQQQKGSLGVDAELECALMTNIGVNHGFQPATFVLGTDYRVAFTLRSATISLAGASRTVDPVLASPGSRFLPLRYTPLDTGRRGTTRRHFVEVFQWVPTQSGPVQLTLDRQQRRIDNWTLFWTAFEVVGTELIRVARDMVLTVGSAQPPANVDGHSSARLRVDDEGRVRWSIDREGGTHVGIALSDEDREEAARVSREEAAADAQIDWDRQRDIERQPTFAYGRSAGCSNLNVQGWDADRAEAVVVSANAALLPLSPIASTFEIALNSAALKVRIDVFESSRRQSPYCTDVRALNDRRESWTAISGRVTLDLTESGDEYGRPIRRTTILISDAEFVSASGQRISQTQPIVLKATLDR